MTDRAQSHGSYRLPLLLLSAGGVLFAAHVWFARPAFDAVLPAAIYNYELELSFEGFGEDVHLATYLPVSNERQTIIAENFELAALRFEDRTTPEGRLGVWAGRPPDGASSVRYVAQLATRAVRYEVPADLGVGTAFRGSTRSALEETEAIPFRHPEIQTLWSTIRPPQPADLQQTVRAIFEYTHEQIKPAPFNGFTDALTALRLGEASCNGKGRLFVALARLNGIPARLIGGVILESGTKRTSHQWVEVFMGGHWVPFDPLNGHYATLPASYLQLYTGDEFLFSHARDINFDHTFRIQRLLAASSNPTASSNSTSQGWFSAVSRFIELNQQISGIFLLFPLAALIVLFCRNVVGLRTFGIFMPMLVAAGCIYTGFLPGMLGFIAILALGAAVHRHLRGMRVLLVARIAAVITVLTALILLVGVLVSDSASPRIALLAVFPVVILSFAAERLQRMAENSHPRELFWTIVWTAGVTGLCYLAFNSLLLRGVFFHFPEVLLVVLAVQLAVGRWTGIRASEYRRFLRLFRAARTPDSAGVLGINARNVHFIARLNAVHWMAVADDKLATKRHLDDIGVPTPRTLVSVESEQELDHRRQALDAPRGFALKPASGSQGNGIVLIAGSENGGFRLLSGDFWTYDQLRAHVRDITRGLYSSGDDPDRALFEELIRPDAFSRELAPKGIPDLRVLVVAGKPVATMLRVPTRQSGGKANLHQGAAGFAVDLASGRIGTGIHGGQVITSHPDSGEILTGREVPHWTRVLEIACAAQRAVPLGYSGIDICLDDERGPVVIEVNARPGIEIQNALQKGLVPDLELALAGA